jgi:putative nucleotidyltransferase with HDIG domain
MKDAGCSSNASRLFQIIGADEIKAKRDVKTTDWTRTSWESLHYALTHVRPQAPFLERVRALFSVALHQQEQSRELVQIRCERGASIARRIGLPETTATAIHSLDEHWNGKGHPDGLRGEQIPHLARILSLAQTLEVFYTTYGPVAALDTARKRSGRWFDPELVRAAVSASKDNGLWADVEEANRRVLELEPPVETLQPGEATFENVCLAFADVIDAKTPFTYRHSREVAEAAVGTARVLGLGEAEITAVRRAALLHDIGKLGVPNDILEKPGSLTSDEWDAIRKHPYYSFQILRRIPNAGAMGEIAASHHEKLDGSGYFRGLRAEHLSLPTRIVTVANVYQALSARRPYRDALTPEEVRRTMRQEAPYALDPACVEALELYNQTKDLVNLAANTANKG